MDTSFALSDVEGYKSFFNENGYVVVDGALTPEEVTLSVDEIWHSQAGLASCEGVQRDDPATWGEEFWPAPGGSGGFVSPTDDHEVKQMWLNRQKPEIVEVFRNILEGEEKLRVSKDRWGIMRPTKNIKFKDGSVQDRPEWKTAASWLHWDQNPWAEMNIKRLQGLLAFTDHTETSGGFLCVPKFNKIFAQWGVDNPYDTVGCSPLHSLVMVPKGDPIQQQVQKVFMKAGSLLIWDSRLPHQNFPNDDDTWRIVQYVTYNPIKEEEEAEQQALLFKMIKCAMIPGPFLEILTELGLKLYGLKRWSDTEDPPLADLLATCTEKDVQALALYKEGAAKEAAGELMEAVKLFSKAYHLNVELEAVVS